MTDKVSIYDHATGEQVERDMTAAEQKERDAEVAASLQALAALEAEAASLRATKVSAYEKMGLSAAEIEALIPTPKPYQKI